jgi:hypothetical protein
MALTLYQHPFAEPGRVTVERCVAQAEDGWFELPCTPGSGWRLRRAYFGPKSGLAPLPEPTARALRRELEGLADHDVEPHES